MNTTTRRGFLGISAIGIGSLAVGPMWSLGDRHERQADNLETLYRQFKNPDRRYSIRPFWFWNGKLNGEELRQQIKTMVEHGVYGAYAHNRDGLETPYLSEEWWSVVGDALKAAREYGFSLCMVDEFEWPSGEARDYWMPGINKSRVVAANPEFQMHRMRPSETRAQGPSRLSIQLPLRPAAVVVGRQTGEETLDGDSLKTLAFEPGTKQLEWDAPAGDWVVFTYAVEPAIGQPDHGTVDLMSHDAVRKYIDIYYQEFHRRYGEYFGNAMPATFADHEGDYGAKLPWTPLLFDTFRRKTGYELEPYLPALTYDIGPKTEKIRCDLLDVVSNLYSENFFGQITDWCRNHGIEHSGHVWEESLFFGPSEQGDFFRILRRLSNPGCDTLVEWGRQSVWLKEVASVADFEGRHVVCENQGVQGESSYLSPEGMKRVSNCLGAWNIGEFIPHAFDYDLSRINFPPDWFRSQPYLPWFQAYADLMRRISFVNRESQHVADILLFYPQVSIWGQSAPAFRSEKMEYLLKNSSWSDDAVDTNEQYAEMKLRLTERRLDYKVGDDHYLGQSRIEGERLNIGSSQFRTLITPPMSTIRRETAGRIQDFFKAGGIVIALRRLPTASVESGRNDPALRQIWEQTFDCRPTLQNFRLKESAAGGRAYFVPRSVSDLLEVLQAVVNPDVEVREGPVDHLYVLHKIKNGVHLHWVVNDAPEPRTSILAFRVTGRPERWDAQTGRRSPVFYQTENDRTLVRVALGPWDAAYITFDTTGPAQPFALKSSNADDFYIESATNNEITVNLKSLVKKSPLFVELNDGRHSFRGERQSQSLEPLEIQGDWELTVESPSIELTYALAIDDSTDRGMKERWYSKSAASREWKGLWLSPMNYSIREWNVIGPFPNTDDHGLQARYPPEHGIDYDAMYSGDSQRVIGWKRVNSADYRTVPQTGAWDLGNMVIRGGPYSSDSFVVNYGEPLRLTPPNGTVYAQTNVYSPSKTDAIIMLATPNPRAVFLNGNEVYSRWLRPLYNQLSDGFAAKIPVHLGTGWNSLLLKFLHNSQNPAAPHFTCRVESRNGTLIPGLFAASRSFADPREGIASGYRWLKFPVPAVAGALKVPPLKNPWVAFVDEEPVSARSEILLPKGTRAVTVRVSALELLGSPFSFSTVPAPLPLGSWKTPGLEHFSGQITYEKRVSVPAGLLTEKVLLDCGEVGVAADTWVNGFHCGSRAWAPYVFDVTDHIRAGENHLRVRVANTAANSRAIGQSRDILDNIDLDGWHGRAIRAVYARVGTL